MFILTIIKFWQAAKCFTKIAKYCTRKIWMLRDIYVKIAKISWKNYFASFAFGEKWKRRTCWMAECLICRKGVELPSLGIHTETREVDRGWGGSESVDSFIEDQAVWPSYDLAPPPPFSCQQVIYFSQSSCLSSVEFTDGRGRRGRGKSQIIRRRESLVFYK